ncbi:large ribosomal subunit protein eL28-like [Lepus europaeus]|uniref:large ribosomal subunit protein eL28-like n=1 Tax=Lepus europaeus TaxID=9983 RepID=UPI002B486CC4|nr:large ribosomal subunit protein eL28-like [Lepus europaeus]
MTAHLQGMAMRNCSSFLMEKNKQTHSKKPNNQKVRNSFHYSLRSYCKTAGVDPTADSKGVMEVMKQTFHVRTTISKNTGDHP